MTRKYSSLSLIHHSLEDHSLTVAEMVPINRSMLFHQLSNSKDTFFFVRVPAISQTDCHWTSENHSFCLKDHLLALARLRSCPFLYRVWELSLPKTCRPTVRDELST